MKLTLMQTDGDAELPFDDVKSFKDDGSTITIKQGTTTLKFSRNLWMVWTGVQR